MLAAGIVQDTFAGEGEGGEEETTGGYLLLPLRLEFFCFLVLEFILQKN